MTTDLATLSPSTGAVDFYVNKINTYHDQLLDLQHGNKIYTRLRLITFLLAAGCFFLGGTNDVSGWLGYTFALGFGFGFIVFASFHEAGELRATIVRQRRIINEQQLARLQRAWDKLPVPSIKVPDNYRCISDDLDLFGTSSLFQFVSSAQTSFGQHTLRDWFIGSPTRAEIVARQQAVVKFAAETQLREELALSAWVVSRGTDGSPAFVAWAEGVPWLESRPWLKWLTRALTGSLVFLSVLFFAGLLSREFFFLAATLNLVTNIIVNVTCGGSTHEIFTKVLYRQQVVLHYSKLFKLLAQLPDDVTFFQETQAMLGATPSEPLALLQRLSRIVRLGNLRKAGLIGLPYLIFQIVFLVDFHILTLLEFWQRHHGHKVRSWFEAVGRLEAIASLAALAHDHPNWTLPDVDNTHADRVQSKALGHPLLPDDVCIRNDVVVGPKNSFLLVSGSNMSGKSTMLRSLGLNLVLAQAGGPVCATEFSTPRVHIVTSMRVQDSLEGGVSFFMAELQRLKAIIDQAKETQEKNDMLVFYLLDEILQGTNSVERHIAVAKVIGKLLSHGSLGAVSTHDLGLANNPELQHACVLVHFRETFTGESSAKEMSFDYKMRTGIAPTTNALKLLEIVGLDST